MHRERVTIWSEGGNPSNPAENAPSSDEKKTTMTASSGTTNASVEGERSPHCVIHDAK